MYSVSPTHLIRTEIPRLEGVSIISILSIVRSDDIAKKTIETISTGWNITKYDHKKRFFSYSERENNVSYISGRSDYTVILCIQKFVTKIPIPGNIRGALMGVALRAPRNDRAACVSFESLGYSKVLARIFMRVSFRSVRIKIV